MERQYIANQQGKLLHNKPPELFTSDQIQLDFTLFSYIIKFTY